MSVRIRLKRMGRKKRAFFRIVVMDSLTPRDGRSIEDIGFYDPLDINALSIKENRLNYWISVGAEVSRPLQRLLSDKIEDSYQKRIIFSRKSSNQRVSKKDLKSLAGT